MESQKIAIVGGGAIGGVMAILLTKNNTQVDLISKHPETKLMAKEKGLRVSGHKGKMKSNVNVLLPSDLLKERYDIVFLATKANDLESALKIITPFLKKESLVVSLQNGICEDRIAQWIGKERTIGCVTGWGATMVDRGVYEMTSGGEFVIGTINGISKKKLNELAKLMELIVPVRISENIYASLYSKLVINSCITTLGVICGEKLGYMLSRKKLRNLFIQIIKEAVAVADQMNLKIEPYSGKIDYKKFVSSETKLANLRRHFTIWLIGQKYRKLKSSSLQSLQRGKPTEIDYFNGYIVNKGKEYNVPVPLNEKLTKMVREIEKGEREISMKNFDEIYNE